jgi:hypothetical protein
MITEQWHICEQKRHARGPRTTPLSEAGGLDSQRSGAEMGDGRSGIAPSPDLTAKLTLFAALGFIRFVGESRPSSRRYPGKERRDFPLTWTMSRAVGQANTTITQKGKLQWHNSRD